MAGHAILISGGEEIAEHLLQSQALTPASKACTSRHRQANEAPPGVITQEFLFSFFLVRRLRP